MDTGAGKKISTLSHFRVGKRLDSTGVPSVQVDVPSLFLGQQRKGCLNWPCPIATVMNILHIIIEPSSGDE